jgi:Tfp pilus assembly protein PilP
MTPTRLSGLILVALTMISVAPVRAELPEEILQRRDPFKMPEITRERGPTSELEMFPTDKFALIGVLSGPTERRAMISAPNGKTYFVKKGVPIGQRKGVIQKITETAIHVREKVINVLGEQENQDIVLQLPTDAKQDVRTITSEQGW